MKKTFLTFALMVFFAVIAQAQGFYWVFFTDKSGSTFNPYEYFDAEAIERYRLNNVSLMDSTNFPLNHGYVSQVEGSCTELVGESRWLNAVGIGATPEQIAEIERMPFVKAVVPIVKSMEYAGKEVVSNYKTDTLNKPIVQNQLLRMQGERFIEKGIDGKGVRIAVFDGGFPNVNTHPAFEHLRANDRIIATWNFPKKRADVYGWHSHGTMVLSCIAGKLDTAYLGLATGAEFLLARTEVNTEPHKEEIWWAMAVEWADKNGADIINSSLGYGKDRHYTSEMDGSSVVAKAANLAARKGILVCNSAGNEGNDDSWETIITPADADSVLAVGGITASLSEYSHIDFSSYGPTADGRMKPNVCNFGTAIVASPSGGCSSVNGTSFSSPLTAGFAACAWQTRKGYTAMQMKSEIEHSADLFPYFDYAFGYGVPQATYFLEGKEITQPTFHFEEDSVNMYLVPNKVAENTSVWYNLQHPNGRLTQYYQGNWCLDTSVLITMNKEKCAGYTANFSIGGYCASFTFDGDLQDTCLTDNVFDITNNYGVSFSRTRDDEHFGKDRHKQLGVFLQFGSMFKTEGGEFRNWNPSMSFGYSLSFEITKSYKLGVALNYHVRYYEVIKDSCTHFDQTFGIPAELMGDVKSKELIERGFDFELFQRVRFASFGQLGDIRWDLGVYGSFNWQRYELAFKHSGGYRSMEQSFSKLTFASPWDWGLVTRFDVSFFGIYGRYRLSGLNKTFEEPRKYFEELPRLEVGIELRFF